MRCVRVCACVCACVRLLLHGHSNDFYNRYSMTVVVAGKGVARTAGVFRGPVMTLFPRRVLATPRNRTKKSSVGGAPRSPPPGRGQMGHCSPQPGSPEPAVVGKRPTLPGPLCGTPEGRGHVGCFRSGLRLSSHVPSQAVPSVPGGESGGRSWKPLHRAEAPGCRVHITSTCLKTGSGRLPRPAGGRPLGSEGCAVEGRSRGAHPGSARLGPPPRDEVFTPEACTEPRPQRGVQGLPGAPPPSWGPSGSKPRSSGR